jgi:hypothetical protein
MRSQSVQSVSQHVTNVCWVMLDLMAELRNWRTLAHMEQVFISDFPYDLILEAFDYPEWQRLRDVAHSRIQLVLEAEALTKDLMLREEETAAQLRRGLPAEEQISTEKRPTEHAAQVQLSIFISFCFLLKARHTSILFVTSIVSCAAGMSWSPVSLLQGKQKRLRKEENEKQQHRDKESKADLRSTLDRDPESWQEVYRALEKYEKSSLKAFLGDYRDFVEDEELLTMQNPYLVKLAKKVFDDLKYDNAFAGSTGSKKGHRGAEKDSSTGLNAMRSALGLLESNPVLVESGSQALAAPGPILPHVSTAVVTGTAMHPPRPPAPCPLRANIQLPSLGLRVYAMKTSVQPQAPAPSQAAASTSQAAAGTSKGIPPSRLWSEALRSGRGPKGTDGSQGTNKVDAGGGSEGRITRGKSAELGQAANKQQNKSIAGLTTLLTEGAANRRATCSRKTQVQDAAASPMG